MIFESFKIGLRGQSAAVMCNANLFAVYERLFSISDCAFFPKRSFVFPRLDRSVLMRGLVVVLIVFTESVCSAFFSCVF